MATAGRGCPGTGLGLPVPPELPFSLGGRGPATRSCLENEWLRLQALSHRATPSHRRLFSMHKVPVVTRCLFITCRESKEPGFGTERGVTASARSQQAAPGLGAALLPSGNRAALRTHRGLPSLVGKPRELAFCFLAFWFILFCFGCSALPAEPWRRRMLGSHTGFVPWTCSCPRSHVRPAPGAL